jgi:excisionase family DNA binding protein
LDAVTSEYLTIEDASNLLGVPAGTLAHWRLHRYGPPYVKLGRHVRYLRSELDAWVRSQPGGGSLVAGAGR